MRSLFFTVCLLIIVGLAPAVAGRQYTATVVSVTGSPVTLTKCEVWARDMNKTYLMAHTSIPDFYVDLGVSFQNVSQQTVSALRLQIKSYDAFNGVLAASTVDTTSNVAAKDLAVAPGQSFDLLGPRGWHAFNAYKNRDHVTCGGCGRAVYRWLDLDGTSTDPGTVSVRGHKNLTEAEEIFRDLL